MHSFPHLLCLLGFILPIASPAQSTGPIAIKTWLFTSQDRLTFDLAPATGSTPDWRTTSITLVRADETGAPFRVPLDLGTAALNPTTGVWRVTSAILSVEPWTPRQPVLYHAIIDLSDQSGHRQTIRERIGFRTFESRDGRFLLNGKPIFLRGLAINPPGRGIPAGLETSRAFAEDYVRFMLRHHVNAIRIPDDETWYDVCDELGMMIFGGNYSGNAQGAEDPAVDVMNTKMPPADLAEAARWYREDKFHPISHHPALVIYAINNETPYTGELGDAWHRFQTAMWEQLRAWDPTRLYIANAGYGLGRTGDICDLHRYWGWYYSSPYTFLHLRDAPMVTFPEKLQPLTFTECVGSYGGPDGRVNLSPNHKNPISQLCWTGHAAQSEQSRLFHAHQSLNFRQATELFRRLRPINPELSGVFPFTIPFLDWHTIRDFDEMQPRPVVKQMALSYSPVLLSWELYTPNVYAGSALEPVLHLINDADDFSALTGAVVHYELRDSSESTVVSGRFDLAELSYYGTSRHPLNLAIPPHLATGRYHLVGTVMRGEEVVTTNRIALFVASGAFVRSGPRPAGSVRLYDPAGGTAQAFDRLGLSYTRIDDAGSFSDSPQPVVVGEAAVVRLPQSRRDELRAFVDAGGRVLMLRQPHSAIDAVNALLSAPVRMPSMDLDNPEYPPPPRPSRQGMNINPERPDHPVFAGLDREMLYTWSDYTGWDETKPGFPRIYPVDDTYVLADKSSLASVGVLANHNVGLEGIALAEFFSGRGSIVFSAFDLAARAGFDPVADRLFTNLVGYLATAGGHEPHVLIDAPIRWGEYDTERGVLTGINSGLMLNSRPALTGSYRGIKIVVHRDGHQFAGRPGGWNTRPGIQYVPYGRRPFGPYVHGGWSGTPLPLDRDTTVGEGRFWCRIPAGKSAAVHRVLNPSDESLAVMFAANDRQTAVLLAAGETAVVHVPLAPGISVVANLMRGDRRLVLLETAFE